MKSFLILLALGLGLAEKLDRTYLPPPGSKFAGGSPGSIQVPLEPPKEPFLGRNDGLPSLGDSQVELGISRGILEPQATTAGDEKPLTYFQNYYKVPTTTTSYAFTQTTTLPPIYETTVIPFNRITTPSTSGDIQTTTGTYTNGQYYNQNLPGFATYRSEQPGLAIGNRGQGDYVYRAPLFENFVNSQLTVPDSIHGNQNLRESTSGSQNQGLIPLNQQLPNVQGPINIGSQSIPPAIANAAIPGYGPYNQQISSQFQQQEPIFGPPGFLPSTAAPQVNMPIRFQTQYGSNNAQPVGSYGQMGIRGTSYTGPAFSDNFVRPGTLQPDQPEYAQNIPKLDGTNVNDLEYSAPIVGQTQGNSQNIIQSSTTNAPISTASSFASYSGTPTSTPIFTSTSLPDIVPSAILPSPSNDIISPIRYKPRPERPQAESDRIAVILNYENVLTPEGFSYTFDTSNGIHADESGTAVDGVKAQGAYSYVGDDGKVYSVIYTADENGFQPRGDHLPTPHPIPEAIQKVIEQAVRDKEAGIFDDGSYDEGKYGYKKYQVPKIGQRRQHSGNAFLNGADIPNMGSTNFEEHKPYKSQSVQRRPISATGDRTLNEKSGKLKNGKYEIPINQQNAKTDSSELIGKPNSDTNFTSVTKPLMNDLSRRRPQTSSTEKPDVESDKFTLQSIDTATPKTYPQGRLPGNTGNRSTFSYNKRPGSEIDSTFVSGSRGGRPQTSDMSGLNSIQNQNPVYNSKNHLNQPTVNQRRGGQNSFTTTIQPRDEETGYQYNPPQNKLRQEGNKFPTRFSITSEDKIEESVENGRSTIKPFITPNIYNEDEEEEKTDQPDVSHTEKLTTTMNIYQSPNNSNNYDDKHPKLNEDSTRSDLLTGDDDVLTTILYTETTVASIRQEYGPQYTNEGTGYDYNSRRVAETGMRPEHGIENQYQYETKAPDYIASTYPMSSSAATTMRPDTRYQTYQPTGLNLGYQSDTESFNKFGQPITTTVTPNLSPFGQNIDLGTNLIVDGFGKPIAGQYNQGFANERYANGYPPNILGTGPNTGNFLPSSNVHGEVRPDLNGDTFNPSVGRFGKPISVQEPTSITFPDAYQTTEKFIGEDFRGPKQPQRFDPKTGYHY